MSKKYYDCPLQAAYMAKEHGVEITWGDEDLPVVWAMFLEYCMSEPNVEKFFVHPDSLHIFEPMVGDKGEDEAGMTCHYTSSGWYVLLQAGKEPFYPLGNVEITRRNNKPFHTPKEES